ncbi:MAG: alkaline phosphatase family protein, partial [Acidobacteriota bacterium]
MALLAFLLSPACRQGPLPGRPSGAHVLIIGLDGADWDRMKPMMEQGRLPALADLVKRGASAKMAVDRPPLSPLLWNTVATGRPPDEHGVLNFVEYDPRVGKMIPISGRRRRVKALWNLADDAGLTSVTLGWWATWPAEEVRGAMVSDRWSYSPVPLPAD